MNRRSRYVHSSLQIPGVRPSIKSGTWAALFPQNFKHFTELRKGT